MIIKRLQLGMIHVAVAMTLVPINSTLNRVMIKELAISATLVALLASLPYLFSPIQVAIGSFSDRHPVAGYRRTPYIVFGLLLCALGVALSPQAAFTLADQPLTGILLCVLAFGSWGMGYNFASVSYLSLATEISGEKGRGRTIAVMWFMMITSIILTAVGLSRMLDPYTPQAMQAAFLTISAAALALGLLGLLRLEPRTAQGPGIKDSYSWAALIRFLMENRQAKIFFIYLVVLLAALLGQDVLIEPFAGETFNMSVRQTTRITSIWGACVLAALLVAGALESRVSKRTVAAIGGTGALIGFSLIALSGALRNTTVFYSGITFLGVGTGLSTVSNLSLMLDMTTADKIGLFIGAWGMANACSRLIGALLGGAVRDLVTSLTGQVVTAYILVFVIMAVIMLLSLIMLRSIDVVRFRQAAEGEVSLIDRAAAATDVG